MTPVKALAWTLAYALAGACVFWGGLSKFVSAAYRYWFVDLLFVCIIGSLSWFEYRRRRRGSQDSFFAGFPKREQRQMAIAGAVFLGCLAVAEFGLAWSNVSDHPFFHFAIPIVWLVLAADNWRRYLELKEPEATREESV